MARFAAAAFFLANLLDAALTAWAIQHGHSEANPFVAIFLRGGLMSFATFKVLAGYAIIWSALNRSKHPRPLLWGAASVLTIVCVWNVYAITLR